MVREGCGLAGLPTGAVSFGGAECGIMVVSLIRSLAIAGNSVTSRLMGLAARCPRRTDRLPTGVAQRQNPGGGDRVAGRLRPQ